MNEEEKKNIFDEAMKRAKRVVEDINAYKTRMTDLFETHKGSFGGSNPLDNGWYMYNDGSYKIQVEEKGGQDNWCSIQGGGKNSKKRTKKKARRRRKKRRRRRTKKRSCKKRMTKKTICLKGINKKAMRKLVKVTKKLGKMKGIKMTRCSKRRIKKWTKKKRRR